MDDKRSSDDLATLASHVLRTGNPLDDDALVDMAIRNVMDAMTTGEIVNARLALREALGQYFTNVKTLAASVLSQADGPE